MSHLVKRSNNVVLLQIYDVLSKSESVHKWAYLGGFYGLKPHNESVPIIKAYKFIKIKETPPKLTPWVPLQYFSGCVLEYAFTMQHNGGLYVYENDALKHCKKRTCCSMHPYTVASSGVSKE